MKTIREDLCTDSGFQRIRNWREWKCAFKRYDPIFIQIFQNSTLVNGALIVGNHVRVSSVQRPNRNRNKYELRNRSVLSRDAKTTAFLRIESNQLSVMQPNRKLFVPYPSNLVQFFANYFAILFIDDEIQTFTKHFNLGVKAIFE